MLNPELGIPTPDAVYADHVENELIALKRRLLLRVEKWRETAYGPVVPAERAIGYAACAKELEEELGINLATGKKA